MEPWYRRSLIAFLTIGLAAAAFAQDKPRPDLPAPNAATLPLNTPTALTGKERLGRKWTDEQRIDNCNVPVDKRGNKPRPAGCPHVPAS